MNKIANKYLLVGDKFVPKFILRLPGFTYYYHLISIFRDIYLFIFFNTLQISLKLNYKNKKLQFLIFNCVTMQG